MRTALLVAGNEFRRRLRDRSAIVTAFVAPIALATIVGLAFDSGDERSGFVRVEVADRANTALSAALIDAVVTWARPGPGIAVERAPSAERALADLGTGRAVGVVIVSDRLVDGIRVPFPEARSRVDSPVGLSVANGLAQAMGDAVSVARQTAGSGFGPGAAAAMLETQPPISIVDEGGGALRGLMGYFGPAVAMVFLFFGIGIGARSVLAERQTGTLARLQAAPVPFSRVIAGKLIAMLALSATSVAVIWATTTWLLGATWGDPVGVVVLSLALVLAMGALALFVTVVARTEAQADAATAAIGFGLALFGGNFFPPSSLPPVFERISLLTPNGWGLQGYGALAIDGEGAGAVVTPVLALALIALVFGSVAVVRFRRTVAL